MDGACSAPVKLPQIQDRLFFMWDYEAMKPATITFSKLVDVFWASIPSQYPP